MDDQVAQGAYSNLAMITHNETEFILDFIFVQPQQPKAKVCARVIPSPGHIISEIKRLVMSNEKSRMIH